MTTYEIIANLCEKHGIAVTALEKELGFGRGYIGKLRTKGTSPTAKKNCSKLRIILMYQMNTL